MTRTALSVALATALFSVGTAASATVTGHCTYEGEKHALVDGIAWVVPEDPDEDHDWDDDGVPDEAVGPDIKLAFASFKLDAGAIQRAEDRHDEMTNQSFAHDDSAKIELTLSPEKIITQQFVWISPGSSLSYGSNEVGKYTVKSAGKGRIAGHYAYTDDDAEGPVCDITFDIVQIGTVAEAPPLAPLPGQALPADGGEPGKVFLALNRAVHARDFDTIDRMLPPAKAAELRAARKTPEFEQQFAFMQAMTAKEVTIKGGRIDGDQAWIEFDAVEGEALRSGTAEMSREGGIWYVRTESTRDRDK